MAWLVHDSWLFKVTLPSLNTIVRWVMEKNGSSFWYLGNWSMSRIYKTRAIVTLFVALRNARPR